MGGKRAKGSDPPFDRVRESGSDRFDRSGICPQPRLTFGHKYNWSQNEPALVVGRNRKSASDGQPAKGHSTFGVAGYRRPDFGLLIRRFVFFMAPKKD